MLVLHRNAPLRTTMYENVEMLRSPLLDPATYCVERVFADLAITGRMKLSLLTRISGGALYLLKPEGNALFGY